MITSSSAPTVLDMQQKPAAPLIETVLPQRPDALLEDEELAALRQRVRPPHVLVEAPELLRSVEVADPLDVVLVLARPSVRPFVVVGGGPFALFPSPLSSGIYELMVQKLYQCHYLMY